MTRKERMNPNRCTTDTQRNHIRNIDKWGVSIVSVSADDENPDLTWTYSVGLWQQYDHPEVRLTGMDGRTAGSLINHLNVRIRDRKERFESGSWNDDVLSGGFRCYFEAIERASYGGLMVGNTWFYGDDSFPAVQALWPDLKGIFPWQDGADPDVVRLQKLLCPIPKRALQ